MEIEQELGYDEDIVMEYDRVGIDTIYNQLILGFLGEHKIGCIPPCGSLFSDKLNHNSVNTVCERSQWFWL